MTELLFGWQGIAGTAIIISIIIGGIALGLGRAFSLKRLEHFGTDELVQSMINAAILGFSVGLSVLVLQVGAELAPSEIAGLNCTANVSPADYALCTINSTSQQSFNLSQDIVRIQNNIGYYSTLSMNFGNFSIQPLANMDGVSSELSNSLYSLQSSAFASALNAQLLSFVSSNWFGVVFGAGLVLRSFFLSRRLGAFLIASSIAFIIFYPLMLLMFPLPKLELETAQNFTSAFLSNASYQTIPIISLNNNSALADKLYNMSFSRGQDYVGDLTLVVQLTTVASAALFFYSAIIPLFALIATGVLIKEFSSSFAGEIATEVSVI